MAKQVVTVELYYSGAWQSAPAYVRDRITISRGRGNETSEPTPSTVNLTLDNRSGAYNPRNASSPLFGLVGRNTPIRVGLDLAVESFGGTSASGWTPTDGGLAWTGVGALAADFTESSGIGRHLQPLKGIVRVSLLADQRRDVEQVTEVSIPAVALGASAVVGHVSRRQAGGDYYWTRLEFDVGGAITAKISRTVSGSFTELAVQSAIPGMTYTAGQSYTIRSSVSGSRVSMRVWPTGTAEPSTWTLTAVDSAPTLTGPGRYGLASWAVTGNTNTTEIRFDNYRAVDRRMVGEVASWKPGRSIEFNPTTGRGDAWTEVEAAGILRRLEQGKDPVASPLRRTIAATDPVVYYPGEDGVAASAAGSAVAGNGPLQVAGSVSFKPIGDYTYNTGTSRYGTSALPDLAAGGGLSASFSGAAASTGSGWTVHVAGQADVNQISGDLVVMEWSTPRGTFNRWQLVVVKATGHTQVIAYDATSGAATVVVDRNGTQLSFSAYVVSAVQNGGNIDVTYRATAGALFTGSVAGTLAGVESLSVNPTLTTSAVAMPFGHLAVWSATSLPYRDGADFDSYGELVSDARRSYHNEAAADRLLRVAAEEGITVDMPPVPVDAVIRMGWQPAATLDDLLAQCTDVDGGYLYEPRDWLALAYRPRDSLYNQAPVLTLDWSAYEVAPPFTPVVDDLGARNDITVKRTDGSSARAVRTSGPLAALPPPDGIGVYDTSVELNLADDSRLNDQAGWALHKGTVDELRVPRVTVDLVGTPGLATAVDVGDRILLTGLPADMGDDEVSLLVVGYTEVIGSHTRTITFNCVPASPYDVATVDGEPRVPSDGSTLAAGITSSATSLSLASATGYGLWTTAAEDFPLDLRIGGERVTVSTITGAASPQTATVTARAVNGVVRAWPADTEVDVWFPAVVAL